MYAIGNITCQAENHGHSISDIKAYIAGVNFKIANYEKYKETIDGLAGRSVYGGNVSAIFRFEPSDNFAWFVPTENITEKEKDA